MAEEAGLDIDFDALEGQVVAVQRMTDPELGSKPVPKVQAVTLNGRQFRLSAKVGLMPILKFAHAANSGLDTSDMRSFDALWEMLHDVIQEEIPPCGECEACAEKREDDCPFYDAGDWDAFERHATVSKADAEELLDVVADAMALITARPTGQPSDSSDSSRRATARSTARSSGRRGAASNGSRRARRAT